MSRIRLDSPNVSWERCPPGTLRQLAEHDGRRRSMGRSLTMAGAVATGTVCALLLLSSLGLMGLNSTTPSDASPSASDRSLSGVRLSYSCRDAIEHRDLFLLGNAVPEAQAAVREHLSHCPPCQAAYRQRAQELKVEYTVLVLPPSSISAFASR